MSKKSVTVEFLAQDKLSPVAKKATESAQDLIEEIRNSSKELNDRISEQQAVIKQLENNLKTLNEQFEKLGEGKGKSEMRNEMEACKRAVDEEKAALRTLQEQMKSSEGGTQRLSRELRQMTEELTRMKRDGLAGTEAYEALLKKAGDLSDALGDVRQEVANMANDDARLAAFTSAVGGLAGGFTAAMGAMSLFGAENEELARIQTRLQSVMAITMGLQQMFDMLNKSSAFSTIVLTKAKHLLVAANIRLTVALGGSTVAAQALMATLTLGLSVAITFIVGLLSNLTTKAIENSKRVEELKQATVELAHKPIAGLIKLQAQWANLGNELEAKKKFINQNQEAFHNLGLVINDVYDAERRLMSPAHTQAFIKAQISKAQAQALLESGEFKDLLHESTGKKAQAKALREEAENDKERLKQNYWKLSYNNSAKLEKSIKDKEKKAAELEAQANNIGNKLANIANRSAQIAAEGEQELNRLNEESANREAHTVGGQIKALEQRLNQLKAERRQLNANDKNAILKKDKEIQEADNQLKKLNSSTVSGSSGSGRSSGGRTYDPKADAQRLEDMREETLRKTTDKEVELIDDAFQKQRKRLEVQHNAELADIAKKEEEKLELLSKLRKAGYQTTITDEQIKNESSALKQKTIDAYNEALAEINDQESKQNEEKRQAQEKEWADFLAGFADFDARRRAVETKYTADVKRLTDARTQENAQEIDAAIKEAGKLRDKQIKIIDNEQLDELSKSSTLVAEFFSSMADKSITQIQSIIRNVELLQKYMAATKDEEGNATITEKGRERTVTKAEIVGLGISAKDLELLEKSPEKLKAFNDRLKELTTTVKERGNPIQKALGDIMEGIALIQKGGKDNAGGNNVLLGIGKIGKATKELIPHLNTAANALSQIFDGGNDAGGSLADELNTAIGLLGDMASIAEGIGSGNPMAVIQGVASIATKWNEAEKRHKEALKRLEADRIAQQREMNLLLLKQNLELEKATTIFGTDTYAKAANAVNVMHDALEQLRKAMRGTAQQQEKFAKQRGFLGIPTNYTAQQKQWAGVADIQIKTGHEKTGLFGWGKGRDTYSSVLSVYPQLISKNGELNAQLAKTILATRQMSDESKASLQHLIDLHEQAEEAWKSTQEYFTGIFGTLGNTLADALVDAFRHGTDASEAFGKSVSDMLARLAKDIAFSVTLAPLFEETQEQMLAVAKNNKLTPAQKFEQYTLVTNNLMQNMGAKEKEFYKLYGMFDEQAKKHGLTLSQSSDTAQRGQAGAFTTMTQEQGKKLEGLFTSGQIHWASIDKMATAISKDVQVINVTLAGIKEDTAYLRYLKGIDERIERLERDGIKVR